MSNAETFEQAAQRHYDCEMEDLRRAARILRVIDEGSLSSHREEEARERVQEICGEPLSVEKKITILVTLGTGGPALGYELDLDVEENEGTGRYGERTIFKRRSLTGGRYWYQDWFEKKRYFELDDDEVDLVKRVYDIYIEEMD